MRGQRTLSRDKSIVGLLASVFIGCLLPPIDALAAENLVVLPSECTLTTPESRQPLIVQEIERGEVGRQRRAGSSGRQAIPRSPRSLTAS